MARILLVDDEQVVLQTVTKLLEKQAHEIITVMDGEQAPEKARQEEPDLIILDLMLPKYDGFEVCKMLREDSKYEKIPILMLTARESIESMKKSIWFGADVYLTNR